MTHGPSKPSLRRVPGLDALRGLAIALVMLRHAWPRVFGEAGAVGVVIFFTLSGYLITGNLLRESESQPHRLIWRFCRNRALRLLPALFILLVTFGAVHGKPGVIVALVGGRDGGRRGQTRRGRCGGRSRWSG